MFKQRAMRLHLGSRTKIKLDPGETVSAVTDAAEKYTTAELISALNLAFRPGEFEKLKHVLLSKEKKMEEDFLMELEKRKADFEEIERNHGELALSRVLIDDELKESKRECENWKEMVRRLNEDLEDVSNREKRAVERLEEMKRQKENDEMRLAELENSKKAAEAKNDILKQKFAALESRVIRLEGNAADLVSLKSEVFRNGETNADSDDGSSFKEIEANCNEEVICLADRNSTGRSPAPEFLQVPDGGIHVSRGIVEISDDSEDETRKEIGPVLKRKRTLCTDVSENETELAGEGSDHKKCKQEIMEAEDLIHEPRSPPRRPPKAASSGAKSVQEFLTPLRQIPSASKLAEVRAKQSSLRRFFSAALSNSDESSTSDSEDDINDLALISKYQNRGNRRWESEGDMVCAFKKDQDLCIKAVCALYRQRTFEEKPDMGNNQEYDMADVVRISSLAKFLLDGDQHVKRSVYELQRYDSKGMEDCQKLAIQYSGQLYEIYRKGQDLFHLPL